MTIYNVSNASELTTALGSATGGDTIICADGSYGNRNFTQTFASDVTIIAENLWGAVFAEVYFSSCTHIVFDGMRVNYAGHQHILVFGTTSYLTIRNCSIGEESGYGTGQAYWGISLQVGNKSNITIHNNYVHNVFNGINFSQYVTDFAVTENLIDHVSGDSLKFAGCSNGVISRNRSGGHYYDVGEPHHDLIQFENVLCTNITLNGNVFLPAPGYSINVEGIFAAGPTSYLTIEQNVIVTSSIRGISVGDNCIIRDNTMLWCRGANTGNASEIFYGTGCTIDRNVLVKTIGNQGPWGTNMVLQPSDPGTAYYDIGQFAGWDGTTATATAADLLPADGSDVGTLGAYTRILELAGQATVPSIGALMLVVVSG